MGKVSESMLDMLIIKSPMDKETNLLTSVQQSCAFAGSKTICAVGKMVVAGKNTIEISCQDVHPFAFCIQIVRPVKKEAVMSQMHPPEKLDAAIMRMRRIVRSGFL